MIVRHLQTAASSERRVNSDGWNSVRLLLQDDAMGFSFHITTIYAGAELPMHYRHHLESVYCIAGTGTVKDLRTGEVHPIAPGVLYALDQHDRHVLSADTDMTMACVFNPPLIGEEVHDDAGAYPRSAEAIA